jgi:SEC-C motif-containing protein
MSSEPIKDNKPKRGQPCPCGSGQLFEACCEPIHAGTKAAANAEQLMRARFTAHVVHNFKFLHDSYRATAGKPYVAEEGEPAMTWTRLEVHGHEVVADHPDKAYVDFSAYGTEEGVEKVLHEKAEFLRINGAWLYNREARLGPAPIRSSAPKVGRNDPCPCGSGKKYKHCCLAKG